MRLSIFNVGHGSCAYLIADPHQGDTSNVALFDCGHDEKAGFWPSSYLRARGCTGVEHLVISHYDEDHLSDLANLRRVLPIQVLHRNESLTADQIRRMKLASGPITPGVEAVLDMISTASSNPMVPPALGGVELTTFSLPYPQFQDTNNLSLVAFVHHPSVSLVLPGDLEKEGWRIMLADRLFREHLRRVRVFVASHHGRENGYLPEVFNHCTPDIVVISDTAIQHDTQENCYAQHARGITMDGTNRRVLTTRRDGHITITTHALGYQVATHRALP